MIPEHLEISEPYEDLMNGAAQTEDVARSAFEETHFAVSYWAERWGFSPKTVREWFRDEHGPGILRLSNAGKRKKRDYTKIMISPSAAARVYTKRTTTGGNLGRAHAR